MLRKLSRISLYLAGLGILIFLGSVAYITVGTVIKRNTLEMLSGPFLDHARLLGPDAHIDSILDWSWKVPLVVSLPKRVENCSASKAIQTSAQLELVTVDSLCNITVHKSGAAFVVRCRSPLGDDKNICFASAYIGGVQMLWSRRSFEEGSASTDIHTTLREVTPFLALDSRISKLATSEDFSRQLNGSFSQSSAALRDYVKQVNEKLKASTFTQIAQYEISFPYVWSYSREQWMGGSRNRLPNQTEYYSDFQEKFQVLVPTQ
jgi:hypothetical protein